MNGEGFTRRRGGAEGERDEVGFGVEDFQPRMGTNGEGMGAKKYLSLSSRPLVPSRRFPGPKRVHAKDAKDAKVRKAITELTLDHTGWREVCRAQ